MSLVYDNSLDYLNVPYCCSVRGAERGTEIKHFRTCICQVGV